MNNLSNYYKILILYKAAVTPIIVVLLLFPNKFTTFLAAVLFLAAVIIDYAEGLRDQKHRIVSAADRILEPIANPRLHCMLL